jgi:hypothetical protein
MSGNGQWLSEGMKRPPATIELGRRTLRTRRTKMIEQPILRPGFPVDPIPAPREKARRLMLATSIAIEGLVDTAPDGVDSRLANCLYMSQADLIIIGTACSRPLLLREAADISAAAGKDVLVVRADEGRAQGSFDVKLAGSETSLCAYRMWMLRPSEAAWLVPVAGKGRCVRLSPLGLEANDAAPFATGWERRKGLAHAREFLSIATQGWF